MALTQTNLNRIANGSCKVFSYISTEAIATVAGSGYFNDITEELSNGDIIIASCGAGGTETVDLLVVNSATGAATVTVANGT